MQNKKNIFQTILMIIFGAGIGIGVILFATNSGGTSGPGSGGRVTIWGTLDATTFRNSLAQVVDSLGDIEVSYVAYEPEVFEQVFVNALASGGGPDLVVIEGQDILSQRDRITPWSYDIFPQSTFAENFIDATQIFLLKEGVYAFPILIDPLVLYSNTNMLTSSFFVNPPATWNEVLEYIPQLVEKTDAGSIIRGGIGLGTGSNVLHAVDIFSALVLQSGNPIVQRLPQKNDFDPEFESVLRSAGAQGQPAPAINSLIFFSSFADTTQPHYAWNPSLDLDRDAFVAGDTALYIGYASEYTDIIKRNPNLNFDVSLLPQIENTSFKSTFARVYGLSVVRTSPQPALAQTVANILGTTASETFSDTFGLPSPRREILKKTQEQDVFQIFNNSAIIAQTWFNPLPSEVDPLFIQAIIDMNIQQDSPQGIISQLEDRINDILRRRR